MKITKLIFLGLLLCLFTNAFSQTEATTEASSYIRPFGVGIHLEQFKIHDMGDYFEEVPSNKVIFTINPSRSIRIEPEVGFNYYKRNNERKNSFVNMGLGAFGMSQYNRLNVYYGARFAYDLLTSKLALATTEVTTKVNFFSMGPAIGCEYFVANQLTLGGEFGVKYGTKSGDDNSQFSNDTKQTGLWTDTGLFLRFYF
ncbi:MAG: hypothetical protein ACM3MI_15885 [Clostridiales bacterium]